jgi:hypothetical protein
LLVAELVLKDLKVDACELPLEGIDVLPLAALLP